MILDENGAFSKWFQSAKSLTPEDRSKNLAENKYIAAAYKDCATATAAEEAGHHYLCYTLVDGKLYEIGKLIFYLALF